MSMAIFNSYYVCLPEGKFCQLIFNHQSHTPLVLQSMAMQQEPIDWRYLPYIRPMFHGFSFQGISPQNMTQNMVLTYLHFRILEFPLMKY